MIPTGSKEKTGKEESNRKPKHKIAMRFHCNTLLTIDGKHSLRVMERIINLDKRNYLAQKPWGHIQTNEETIKIFPSLKNGKYE